MAEQLQNGKWSPIVWRDGVIVNMIELVNNDFKLVECDTKEEAEQKEKEYNQIWNK